jgi:hypothetical protein
MSLPRASLIIVGVASIALAVVGLAYNSVTLRVDYSGLLQTTVKAPYFYPSLYVMSGVCISCYLALIFIGVQLVCGSANLARLLLLVIPFEVLNFLGIGFMWALPEYGMSIAAATGVANGGLMFQTFTLSPVWAPLTVFFASRSLRREQATHAELDRDVSAR